MPEAKWYNFNQKPLSAKRPAKTKNSPFEQNRERRRSKGRAKETKNYKIKSQIKSHKKLTKISNAIRKNPRILKEFKALRQNLKNGNMKASRGSKFLPDSNGIFYARGFTEGARIYYQYYVNDIIILADSNKTIKDAVIYF